MGKFDGVLFITDYDDTLYNSRLEVSPGNRAAIRYFLDNGGWYTIATGRAYPTFTPQIEKEHLEFNAPVVLANGAAIYDYSAGRYLVQTCLPPASPRWLEALCERFPALGFEAYRGDDIFAFRPNHVTCAHLKRVGMGYTVCHTVSDIPTPWGKVILQQDGPYLREVQEFFLSHWGEDCEAIFSNPYLLEVTAKGSDKGAMAAKVAELLGVAPEHLYCMGDNQNDIPMLSRSAIPFAPGNCAQAVRDWGARLLRPCDEDAVAQAIEILDGIY